MKIGLNLLLEALIVSVFCLQVVKKGLGLEYFVRLSVFWEFRSFSHDRWRLRKHIDGLSVKCGQNIKG